MGDMLVKLYALPEINTLLKKQEEAGICIRRAIAPEKHVVVDWVRQTFNAGWGSECEVAFSSHPVSCFIAIENDKIAGFACYEVAYKNFFGPTGVSEIKRGKGIGKILLLSCLHAMAEQGYAYAIIGGVGPAEFYSKTVGAVEIKDSAPGIYRGMLK